MTASSTASSGPPIEPPPRNSSHHRTHTATAPAADVESVGRSTGANPSRSQPGIAQGNAFAQQQPAATIAAADVAQSRRRAHHYPKDGSTSGRGKQAPGHSRSQSAVNQPPIGTDLPREESTIINRLVITDPSEDIAREKARIAESRPLHGENDITTSTGLTLVGPDGVDDGGRGTSKIRQEKKTKEIRFGDYILGQTLGEGEFGKVKMGWKRDGGVQVAIKLIRRETLGNNPSRLPKIYREISILRGLQHPNIVRLHEMVETERHIGIILEYASGGELFDYILQHRFLKDNAARRLFAQLVSGVGYLHKAGIVHRDLKLENLLLDRNRNIIITDFGFANTFNPNDELNEEIEYKLTDRDFVKKMGLEQAGSDGHRRGDLMQTSCGSPCYAAPELVVSDSLYTGRKVDVWSCGVILVRFGPVSLRMTLADDLSVRDACWLSSI
jgi:protein-serine/threonine kinase